MNKVFDTSKIALMIAEHVRDRATDHDLVPFLSGDLRKSLQTAGSGAGSAVIFSNLPYARAVHDGRPAIVIKPNIESNPHYGDRKSKDKAKARLRFKIGGRVIYAKEVHQKARKGKPFILEAIKELEDENFDFLDDYLQRQFGIEAAGIAGRVNVNIKL